VGPKRAVAKRKNQGDESEEDDYDSFIDDNDEGISFCC